MWTLDGIESTRLQGFGFVTIDWRFHGRDYADGVWTGMS